MAMLDEIARAFKEGVGSGYRDAAREAEIARRRTNEWGAGLRSIIPLVGGTFGIAGAFQALNKSVEQFGNFINTQVGLKNFSRDTNLATKEILEFQQAGLRIGKGTESINKTLSNLSNQMQDLHSRGSFGSIIFGNFKDMEGGINLVQKLDEVSGTRGAGGAIRYLLELFPKLSGNMKFEVAQRFGETVSSMESLSAAMRANIEVWPVASKASDEFLGKQTSLQAVLGNMQRVVDDEVAKALNDLDNYYGITFNAIGIKQENFQTKTHAVFSEVVTDIKASITAVKEAWEWLDQATKKGESVGGQGIMEIAGAVGGGIKDWAMDSDSRQKTRDKYFGITPDTYVKPYDTKIPDTQGGRGWLKEMITPWKDWWENLSKKDVMHELGLKSGALGATDSGFDFGRMDIVKTIESGTEKGVVSGMEKVFGVGVGTGGGDGGGGFTPGLRGGTGGMRNIRYGGVGGAGSGGTTGRTPGGFWTEEHRQYAIDRLQKEAGLSEEGARGLVARWTLESGGKGPWAQNFSGGGHKGIGQWGIARQDGVVLGDYEGQVTHAIKELNTREWRAARQLRSAKTPGEAAIGGSMFERAEHWNPATGTDTLTGATLGTMGKMTAADEARRRADAEAERTRIRSAVGTGKASLGRASIDINVKAPRGTITNASGDGVFQDINVKRMPQAAEAGAANNSGYSPLSHE